MAGVTLKIYRELNKIYNVHLVDTYLSSYECIKNSEAVMQSQELQACTGH